MYHHVLIATDGSDLATRAGEQGLAIAEAAGATVHVVSVLEELEGETPTDTERKRHRDWVEQIESAAIDRGCDVVTSVPTGHPSRAILEYADENGIDLVVLGTHGRTGLKRWIMGSVASAVVREARCHVLTVNGSVQTVQEQFDDILIATDGRPGVDRAVDAGLDLAEAAGATVHSLYVVDDVHSRTNVVLESFEAVGEQSTAVIAARAAERGLSSERAIQRGIPHEEIVAYADERDIDLVVMGVESLSSLERLVVGSVSQRVVATAPAPVLTVRTLSK
ncbi:universal stress protein [Natronosalvus vescus]|uniref:universal stress protein n=1 Tax=Natronosalvus vescus TaxID=2953881 RepID=UPI0020904A64|nr:universal stress protein [Natronosalvus vescus]